MTDFEKQSLHYLNQIAERLRTLVEEVRRLNETQAGRAESARSEPGPAEPGE